MLKLNTQSPSEIGLQVARGSLNLSTRSTAQLQIQPVRHFQHQGPVFHQRPLKKLIGKIIVRIHQKQIRYRAETPLQAAVDVDIVDLSVVLQKSTKKQTAAKRQLGAWPNQPKAGAVVGRGQVNVVVGIRQGKYTVGLQAVDQLAIDAENVAIEILARADIDFIGKWFAEVRGITKIGGMVRKFSTFR